MSNEFGPVKPKFLVVVLYIFLISYKYGNVLTGKEPTWELFNVSDLTVFSVLFEDAIKMDLWVIVVERVNLLKDPVAVFEMLGGEFKFIVSW